jgi:hypothetical protein
VTAFDAAHAHNACAALTQMYGAALLDKQQECEQLRGLVKARDAMIELQGQQLSEARAEARDLRAVVSAQEARILQVQAATESRLSVNEDYP